MPQLNLTHLKLTKEQIGRAPEDEIAFYFQMGLFYNEIVILRKLNLYLENGLSTQGSAESDGRTAMLLLTLRFAAGRLYEAHAVLSRKGNGRRLAILAAKSPDDPTLAELFSEGQSAQKILSKYFGRSKNLLGQIRNRLAFHSHPEEILKSFQSFPDSHNFVDYIAPHVGDTLYQSSEELIQNVLIDLAAGETEDISIQRLSDDISTLSGALEDYASCYRLLFLAIYVPEILEHLNADAQDHEVPAIEKVTLPFFVNPDSLADSLGS